MAKTTKAKPEMMEISKQDAIIIGAHLLSHYQFRMSRRNAEIANSSAKAFDDSMRDLGSLVVLMHEALIINLQTEHRPLIG